MRVAFLYWTVSSRGQMVPAGADRMLIRRVGPSLGAEQTVTGTIVGQGPDPCWGVDVITVFRGRVPVRIVNGNGSYLVSPLPGVPGRSDGSDPWISPVPPFFNGASLVAVSDGKGVAVIYEGPLSGSTFASGTLSYGLAVPPALRDRRRPTKFHQIGSDGQEGGGSGLVSSAALEVVRVNGTAISGPGSPVGDGDWNGSAGHPGTQLWDNRLRDISAVVRNRARNVRVEIDSPGDCITPVANILAR